MMLFKTGTATDFVDAVRADEFRAIQAFAEGVAETIREKISVDVEYATNRKGTLVVVKRSLPGEPPRRETGDLYRSIAASTAEADAGEVSVEVSSDMFYAPILEEKMDRPYLASTLDETFDDFCDRMVSAMQGA
jgi:hypothetical protein